MPSSPLYWGFSAAASQGPCCLLPLAAWKGSSAGGKPGSLQGREPGSLGLVETRCLSGSLVLRRVDCSSEKIQGCFC